MPALKATNAHTAIKITATAIVIISSILNSSLHKISNFNNYGQTVFNSQLNKNKKVHFIILYLFGAYVNVFLWIL